MGKRGIRDILSETQDSISCIEENTRERVEALMKRYEKDKKRCIEMGNKALQGAVTNDLIPKHEQFEFAVKKIDTDIGESLGQLLALRHNRIKTPQGDRRRRGGTMC